METDLELAGGSFELLLVNAQHIKRVPGRKTDVQDSEWLADLLQHGLVKASFIPPVAQRDRRDLTRQRTQPDPEGSGRGQHQIEFGRE